MIQAEGLPTLDIEEPRLHYESVALLAQSGNLAQSGKIIRQMSEAQVIQSLNDPIESQSPTQPKVMAEIQTMVICILSTTKDDSLLTLYQGVIRTDDFNTQLLQSSPLKTQQPSLGTPGVPSQSMPFTYTQSVLQHIEQSQLTPSQGNKSLNIGHFNACECQDDSSTPKSQLLVIEDNIVCRVPISSMLALKLTVIAGLCYLPRTPSFRMLWLHRRCRARDFHLLHLP